MTTTRSRSAWTCLPQTAPALARRFPRRLIDLTATPKHTNGAIFVQTLSDYPLVEAIRQGVVKTPVLPDAASRAKLHERKSAKFTERYQDYLHLGFLEWQKIYDELEPAGKKSILFVMTDDTRNCDEVGEYLEARYPELRGAVLVIHTTKNGEISEAASGKGKEELEKLRKESREIDQQDNKVELRRQLAAFEPKLIADVLDVLEPRHALIVDVMGFVVQDDQIRHVADYLPHVNPCLIRLAGRTLAEEVICGVVVLNARDVRVVVHALDVGEEDVAGVADDDADLVLQVQRDLEVVLPVLPLVAPFSGNTGSS